jgi:4-aminobutyrate aminotransferase-like enzyme
MSTDGPFHNVLKIKPPMCFNLQNAVFFLKTLEKVLREDYLNYAIMKEGKTQKIA